MPVEKDFSVSERYYIAGKPHSSAGLQGQSIGPELSGKLWWRIRDLNPGHMDYDSTALTTELIRHSP